MLFSEFWVPSIFDYASHASHVRLARTLTFEFRNVILLDYYGLSQSLLEQKIRLFI